MNEFSIVCRVLGTLFYRQPQDPLLVPLFALIKEGKLQQHWPLEQDDLLKRLQQGLRRQPAGDRFQRDVRRQRMQRVAVPLRLRRRRQRGGSAHLPAAARHAAGGGAGRPFRPAAAGSVLAGRSVAGKMKRRRRSSCSTSSCCHGAAASSAKWKRTPPPLSTARWR